jgi:hypothetical protein
MTAQQFRSKAVDVLGEAMREACFSWEVNTLMLHLRRAGPRGMRLRALYLSAQ